MAGKVINALQLGEQIKRKLRAHLRDLGFGRDNTGALVPSELSKEGYRTVHRHQREAKAALTAKRLDDWEKRFGGFFASGSDIDPAKIEPELEEVDSEKWQTELFRYASLAWSIPVSNGYGRRMRFLVWDRQNRKLIGLIALGDPVFNMRARDAEIGWSVDDRKARLVYMLDAFVLGALPPYNQLLGGKLVACLVRSRDIVDRFAVKYGKTQGIISEEHKNARLVCITTTSALGKSSVYNRLKLGETLYFDSIGFTSGYGHFQIPDTLFNEMRRYLQRRRDPYAKGHKFGTGPNWRMRVVRRTLERLGLNPELVRHNMKREIFICPLAKNAFRVLNGKNRRPNYDKLLSVAEIGVAARERWLIPRSVRRPEYRTWTSQQTIEMIRGDEPTSTKSEKTETRVA